MYGPRIEQVNKALPELKNRLVEFAADNNIDIRFRAIAFSNNIKWIVGSEAEGVLLQDIIWSEIKTDGPTNTALAISTANKCLSPTKLGIESGGQARRPIVILITDGLTTSPRDEYLAAIEEMKNQLAGKSGKEKVIRAAIGVMVDNKEELVEFASVSTKGKGTNKPLVFGVDDISELVSFIVELSTRCVKLSMAPINPDYDEGKYTDW